MDRRWIGLRRGLREVVGGLRDLLLPPLCLVCGVAAPELCAPCRAHLVKRRGPSCWRCGERLVAAISRCPQDHAYLRGIAWHVAPLAYCGTGGALVRRFKLDANAAAGHFLARAMSEWVAVRLHGPWRQACVVPVPLHAARRRERGFDQAHWMAVQVATRLRLPRVASALTRVKATLPQGDPRVTSREQNVEAAFRLRSPAEVRGRPVLLVDDVSTSGATARACARLLKQAGVQEVGLLTACRS